MDGGSELPAGGNLTQIIVCDMAIPFVSSWTTWVDNSLCTLALVVGRLPSPLLTIFCLPQFPCFFFPFLISREILLTKLCCLGRKQISAQTLTLNFPPYVVYTICKQNKTQVGIKVKRIFIVCVKIGKWPFYNCSFFDYGLIRKKWH